ncbi:cell wall-active antibiotics response protein LiaF [Alkalicoccus daliensis]|uniref:Cell wall-active antibiotics response 4TMS YvqF n=1 Tax=Alkalicoccus daliensis TaxID=745820 RepID=A0A1G9ZFJ4_9BACI|nr:cell wall-active antibiotics response protein LiaF [Alkalicoccus daliensis]SDN19751.1 Cell wall-active antibiotics response 4TMS YvqF [Alkalicoccus daliensis]
MRKWVTIFLAAAGILFVLNSIELIQLHFSQILLLGITVVLLLLGFVWFLQGISIFYRSLKRDRKHIGRLTAGIWLIITAFAAGSQLSERLNLQTADFWSWTWGLLLFYLAFKLFMDRDRTKVVKFDKEQGGRLKNRNKKNNTFKKQRSAFAGDIHLGKDAWHVHGRTVKMGVGSVYLDFSNAQLAEGVNEIYIQCGIGSIEIALPEGTAADITAHAKLGEMTLFKNSQSGAGRTLSFKSSDYQDSLKKVQLHIEVGIGDVKVKHIGAK